MAAQVFTLGFAVTVTAPSNGSAVPLVIPGGFGVNNNFRVVRQNNTVRVFISAGTQCTKATGTELIAGVVEVFGGGSSANYSVCTDGTGTCDVNLTVGPGQ
jgi:hypothetical protein